VIALTGLVLVIAVLVLVCLFAIMDQYRTLEEVREHLGTGDAPRPLTHPTTPVVASEIGLPARLDGADHAVILFVSTTCATCATVARGLRGPLAPDIHIVLKAVSEPDGVTWCGEIGLDPDHVTIATDDRIADAFGLRVTPAGFVLHHDRIAVAQTVPTPRQLVALLDQAAALAVGPPVGARPLGDDRAR
jgi:hypothetical protein